MLRGDLCLVADTKLSCLLRGVGENIQKDPEMFTNLTSGGKHVVRLQDLLLNWIQSKILSVSTFCIIGLTKPTRIVFLPLDRIYLSMTIMTVPTMILTYADYM